MDIRPDLATHSRSPVRPAGPGIPSVRGRLYRRTSSIASVELPRGDGPDAQTGTAAVTSSEPISEADVPGQPHVRLNILIRVLVFALILASAGLGAWYTVVNGPDQQQQLFSSSFAGLVSRLQVLLPLALELQGAAASLAESAFIFQDANATTLPSFPPFYFLGSSLAVTSKSTAVGFAPAIAANGRSAFEESLLSNYVSIYAGDPTMTQAASFGIWETGANATWPRNAGSSPSGAVKKTYAQNRPTYFPLTYLAPVVNNQRLFLWDIYSSPLHKAAIDAALQYGSGGGGAYTTDLFYMGGRPTAAAVRPVLTPYRSLIGVTFVSWAWEQLLATGGLASIVGLDVAIESSSGSSFTFRLNGAYPLARGTGLRPDNGMAVYAKVVTGSLGNTWRFHIWPTSDFHDSFFVSIGREIVIVIISITSAVCALFLVWDTLTTQRTRRLVRTMAAATRIIDDVFPSTVKDRLMLDVTNKAPGPAAGDGEVSGIIADDYPETSVLFSDIVSFTTWASSQTPTKVFEVLECMFGAFDAAAKVLGVFKVETIGDAYVAAAGVPVPSEFHAAVIADMAIAMRGAMVAVREETGVPGLRIRIGIHSGPVTAGVIRAQNKRFQLFGDTMNCASRMESTGEADKIQISEATFRELSLLGTHVMEPRGVITVKGKGELSTYWLLSCVDDDGLGDDELNAAVDSAAPNSEPANGSVSGWSVGPSFLDAGRRAPAGCCWPGAPSPQRRLRGGSGSFSLSRTDQPIPLPEPTPAPLPPDPSTPSLPNSPHARSEVHPASPRASTMVALDIARRRSAAAAAAEAARLPGRIRAMSIGGSMG